MKPPGAGTFLEGCFDSDEFAGDGFYVGQAKLQSCPANCKECSSSRCTKCYPNFRLGSNGCTPMMRTDMPDGCRKMNQGRCTDCTPKFTLVTTWAGQTQCLPSAGTNGFGPDADGGLVPCRSGSCTACSKDYATCTQCTNKLVAESGVCKSACSFGSYAGDGVCFSCPQNCAACTSGSQCTVCTVGMDLFTNIDGATLCVPATASATSVASVSSVSAVSASSASAASASAVAASSSAAAFAASVSSVMSALDASVRLASIASVASESSSSAAAAVSAESVASVSSAAAASVSSASAASVSSDSAASVSSASAALAVAESSASAASVASAALASSTRLSESATPTSLAPSSKRAGNDSNAQSNAASGSPIAAVAGGLGGACFLLLVLVAVVLLRRRRTRPPMRKHHPGVVTLVALNRSHGSRTSANAISMQAGLSTYDNYVVPGEGDLYQSVGDGHMQRPLPDKGEDNYVQPSDTYAAHYQSLDTYYDPQPAPKRAYAAYDTVPGVESEAIYAEYTAAKKPDQDQAIYNEPMRQPAEPTSMNLAVNALSVDQKDTYALPDNSEMAGGEDVYHMPDDAQPSTFSPV
ncbi:hypothetical protein CAOG_002438 [Capsaspora owczarzaki ATCC 30864]|uniref:TNFR-Cys domain-containing protein n=2 Tax=Capsaspora owczarzaki (strain ATCC 30864) TaxID=595528 RepID=A0A0D2X1R7_CAPO3|nr:hypothetical protein CAOG_002438 [Capsaspora owczarzaki ATCC 30864]